MPGGMPMMDTRHVVSHDPHMANSVYAGIGQYAVSTVQWVDRKTSFSTVKNSTKKYFDPLCFTCSLDTLPKPKPRFNG